MNVEKAPQAASAGGDLAPRVERACAIEDSQGLIRWLCPDFQNPSGQKAATPAPLPIGDPGAIDVVRITRDEVLTRRRVEVGGRGGASHCRQGDGSAELTNALG